MLACDNSAPVVDNAPDMPITVHSVTCRTTGRYRIRCFVKRIELLCQPQIGRGRTVRVIRENTQKISCTPGKGKRQGEREAVPCPHRSSRYGFEFPYKRRSQGLQSAIIGPLRPQETTDFGAVAPRCCTVGLVRRCVASYPKWLAVREEPLHRGPALLPRPCWHLAFLKLTAAGARLLPDSW